MDLTEARARIDEIDAAMAALFAQRMEAVAAVADWKAAHGLPILDAAREAENLARGEARMADPALRPHYRQFLKDLMSVSKAYQRERMAAPEAGVLHVPVPLGERGYDIAIGSGLLRSAGARLNLDRRVLIVTDEGVPEAYEEALSAQCAAPVTVRLPQGEGSKSMACLQRLLETMLKNSFGRGDAVCALGGGMVGDLAGLAAALYMRGVDFYNLPTTLLSQVDSSVGGKTAVNLAGVKNPVGAFYQPKAVLIDTDTLATLPRRQWASGLAEAVKMGLIGDAALFERFERGITDADLGEIIAAALRQKAAVVTADEREGGLRKCLNFGHTLGHGIEAAAEGALTHGECVGLGMLPMCSPEVRARLLPVLEGLGLPTVCQVDPERAFAALLHDKKASGGTISAVWVERPGGFSLESCAPEVLRERLNLVVRP